MSLAEILTTPHPIHDGIYFDLDADKYHDDVALGSTDMKMLAANPVRWWYWSKLNPRQPVEKDTPARLFGRAVHKIVLEGRPAFDKLYGPLDHDGRTKAGIAEREALARAGRTPLSREDYDRALIAGYHIRKDPDLGEAFQGGYPEVSVFWTRDGIRRKARFDYLKIRSLVDLKSAREQDEVEFDAFCKREIARRRYYVQMAHYVEARRAMADLWQVGRASGSFDRAWMLRVIEEKSFAWTWVFYQSSGAPETFGVYTDTTRPMYMTGQRLIADAEYNYREFSARFEPGTPWVRSRRLEMYMEDEQPSWVWT